MVQDFIDYDVFVLGYLFIYFFNFDLQRSSFYHSSVAAKEKAMLKVNSVLNGFDDRLKFMLSFNTRMIWLNC